MNLTEYKDETRQKILIYGPPKSGKTAAVGKLAESGKRLHWFDLEFGIKTLLDPKMLDVEARKNIQVFALPDTATYPIAVETLLKLVKLKSVKICHTHGKVSCPICKSPEQSTPINLADFTDNDILVIDSCTQLTNSAMNHLTKAERLKDELYKPSFHDYRDQGALMDVIFSELRALPIHICAMSHEALVTMKDGREKLVPIGGTTNFSKSFAKYFDHVVYAEVLNKKHRLYNITTHSNSILTGSRSPVDLSKEDSKGLISLFDVA